MSFPNGFRKVFRLDICQCPRWSTLPFPRSRGDGSTMHVDPEAAYGGLGRLVDRHGKRVRSTLVRSRYFYLRGRRLVSLDSTGRGGSSGTTIWRRARFGGRGSGFFEIHLGAGRSGRIAPRQVQCDTRPGGTELQHERSSAQLCYRRTSESAKPSRVSKAVVRLGRKFPATKSHLRRWRTAKTPPRPNRGFTNLPTFTNRHCRSLGPFLMPKSRPLA